MNPSSPNTAQTTPRQDAVELLRETRREMTPFLAPDLRRRIDAALSSTRSAGGEVEPVAWRSRQHTQPDGWVLLKRPPQLDDPYVVTEPLYASPQPARMPTRDSLIGLLSDWFEGKVYGFIDTGEETIRALDGAEFNHFALADSLLALFHTGETKGDGRG